MDVQVSGKVVQTDEQGYLYNLEDWSEDFAEKIAELDGIKLFDDHWGLILYFRDYYHETSSVPTMRMIVRTLGKRKSEPIRKGKSYERFLYKLFPSDPVRELCKLAGLPKPQPDS